MKTIIFQGDSITDCGHSRELEYFTGCGYATLVASRIAFDNPGEYRFLNRGISGNRIVDLYARIKSDIINLAPDYLSILIGVNDVWHEIDRHNGVDCDRFEKIYTMMLEEIYEALPNIKIMLFAPFVLKGCATESTEECPDKWETFQKEVPLRASVAERVAEKFNIPFITLQDKFDKGVGITGDTTFWVRDGIHPAHAGHELIARAWLEAFDTIK